MTTSILKQDPNTWKMKKNAIYYNKTWHANFQGKPLFQAKIQHLNNSQMVKNEM